MRAIWLDDGRRVELGALAGGGSKNETRFGQLGPQPVVVKIERAHGHLVAEEPALRFLAAHRLRVPRVLASGETPARERFLVLSREEGTRPITAAGWERFGRDLAALLGEDLADAITRELSRVASVARLVVTHGDPGSGNYLDNQSGRAVLLDWETASVAPFGLDLGRACFIGLMDLGQTGIAEQLVTALIHGYLAAASAPLEITPELLRAWTAVAGLQSWP